MTRVRSHTALMRLADRLADSAGTCERFAQVQEARGDLVGATLSRGSATGLTLAAEMARNEAKFQ